MVLRASISNSWHDAAGAWTGERAITLTPFQAPHWLSAWYRTLGRTAKVKPLIVTVWRGDEPVALFPLISSQSGNARVIEFADLGVTDYNAMIWSAALEREPALAEPIWQLLCKTLADEGDYICLTKMPLGYGARRHPLGGLEAAVAIEHNTNILSVGDSWESHHRGLPRKFRKELERSFRVFQRDGAPGRFAVAETAAEARAYLAELARHQRLRMKDAPTRYVLDDALFPEFYSALITEEAIAGGDVVLSALVARDGEVVAALMGIRRGQDYAMVRLGHNVEEWGHCSAGRVVIERTMAHLHGQDVRSFDFTIGNYAYKDAFQVAQMPLMEIARPLTMRGHYVVRSARAKRGLRELMERKPAIKSAVRYLRGVARSLA